MKTYTELIVGKDYISSYSSDHKTGAYIISDIIGIQVNNTASYNNYYDYVGKLLNDDRCHIINIEDRYTKVQPICYIHLWYEENDKNKTVTID